MDVLDHLVEEHRKVEALLKQLGDSDAGPGRERMLADLEEMLRIHMAVEEQFVYPIADDVLDDDDDVEEGENEHDLARDVIENARELVAEPGFGAAIEMLTAGLEHHHGEEERDMFPELHEKAAERIRDLGDPEVLEAKVRT
ncbi:MAG TPA: hemerythrin domain-containing protein [Microthrixaceae bacterium]|nr:hemerythrin domain-containing protein [Microthrixaceae bacterium]